MVPTCQHISYVAILPFYSDCAVLKYTRSRFMCVQASEYEFPSHSSLLNYVSQTVHLLHYLCLPLKALFFPLVKVLCRPLTRSLNDSPLRVAVRPLDVHILGANQPLSASRRYDLLCQSSGSRPPATITWWRNGQRLTKTKETVSKIYIIIHLHDYNILHKLIFTL